MRIQSTNLAIVALFSMGLTVGWSSVSPRAADGPSETLNYLPDDFEGVKVCGAKEHFMGNKLFDYMDGGAELYLAYGFDDIGVRNYQKGETKVTLEIYRMGGETEAYGIFAFASRGEDAGFGVPAVLTNGMLSFFKGRYYVRVVAKSNFASAKELLVMVGKQVLSKLPGNARLPKEVSLLPSGAQNGSVRFLLNPETARTVWFDGEADLLLSPKAQAITAVYAVGDTDLQLTRVSYATPTLAAEACKALAKKLGVALSETPGACTASGKTSDDLFSAIATKENILRWVSGANDLQSAQDWLLKVQ